MGWGKRWLAGLARGFESFRNRLSLSFDVRKNAPFFLPCFPPHRFISIRGGWGVRRDRSTPPPCCLLLFACKQVELDCRPTTSKSYILYYNLCAVITYPFTCPKGPQSCIVVTGSSIHPPIHTSLIRCQTLDCLSKD